MRRYNLLDEKWIMVLRKDTGQTEKVSLKEVFARAGDYYDLAGEMKTQDFAVLRVLLAVIQTVFSRFDSDGNPYDFVKIDEQTFKQLQPVYLEDLDDEDPFFETWLSLWEKGEFPEIVQEYLEAWRDRFYLFDDKYPFYQVTPDEMEDLVEDKYKKHVKSKDDTGKIYGRFLNRTISESKNEDKVAIFTPAVDTTKDNLYNDQLARWLIMFQGYTATADKSKVKGTEKTTKGWLYDLGGIYLKGHNLFETLMLNCILSSDFDEQFDDEVMKTQIPAWERSPLENVDIYFKNQIDNRASLYTSWSRAISFMEDYQEGKPFCCFPAKLQEINHVDNFIEPMTCWTWNKSGDNSGSFTPKVHEKDKAVWRNFNVLMGIRGKEEKNSRKPGILSWYYKVCENSSMSELRNLKVTICTVSMQKMTGNGAASNIPVDEIVDEIQMETAVLIDEKKDGWINKINDEVNDTETYINETLISFISQVALIRSNKNDKEKLSNKENEYKKHLEEQEREKLYLEIDQSFREWLYGIKEEDSMNDKGLEWYRTLKEAILDRGKEISGNASFKDLKGIEHKDKGFMNIARAYNEFEQNVNSKFKFLQKGGKQ